MYNYSPARAPEPANTAGGWYADPSGQHQYRYWDGFAWTSAVSDDGVRSDDMPVQDPRPERNGKSRVGGFMTSLPGFLTGIAALITAGGTIILSTKDDPAPSAPLVAAAEDLGVDIQDEPDSAPAYSDYMTVSDETGTIVVDVPVEWSDVDDTLLPIDDGTSIPDVAASPDLDAAQGYGAPGVEVSATDIGVIDVATAMAWLAPTDCTSAGTEDYDDGVFEGQIEYFTDCGGTDTLYLLLAAEYKPDPERIAIVRAQILSDADVDAVGQALDTFDFVS
ncbi:MAG TPA: DUF2510 domain-containing protein [Acidimicrobiales bacterium]|jgi:hypothetical protein